MSNSPNHFNPTKGRRRTKEERDNISRAVTKAHKRMRRELGPLPSFGKKRCSRCGLWKPYDLQDPECSEFTIRRTTRKSGYVHVAPAPQCRQCDRERAAERRAAIQADPEKHEEYKQKQREWNAQRDPEAKRKYSRHYHWKKSREAGVPLRKGGPYVKDERVSRIFVDPGPFRQFIRQYLQDNPAMSVNRMAEKSGFDPSNLMRKLEGGSERIDLAIVDLILTMGLGMPDQVNVLYPNA